MPFDEFFLARQPILGRDQHLVAFELLFRTAGSTEANVTDDAAATAAVISHASQLGMEHVVGAHLAFVNVTEAALMSDYVRFLPADKVILEILETVKATPELIDRVKELKALGFKFALDDVVAESEDVRALVELVDVIKIDVKGVDAGAAAGADRGPAARAQKTAGRKGRDAGRIQPVPGARLRIFPGLLFCPSRHPLGQKNRAIGTGDPRPARAGQFGSGQPHHRTGGQARCADQPEPAAAGEYRRRPACAAGSTRLAQAIEVLGRQQLQRWLQILLYATPGAQVEMNLPLLQMATTRGKMLELMSLKIHPGNRDAAETGFTVGIMSLTDALFSMSMEDILDTVDVAGEVRSALLHREGEYGEMLNIVEMLEKAKCGRALDRGAAPPRPHHQGPARHRAGRLRMDQRAGPGSPLAISLPSARRSREGVSR